MPPKPASAPAKKAEGSKAPAKKPTSSSSAPSSKAAPSKSSSSSSSSSSKSAPSKAAPAKGKAAPAKGKAAAPSKAAPAKAAPSTVKGGKGKVTKGKKVAPIPEALKTQVAKPKKKKYVNPLLEKRSKDFSIGGTVQPKRDLGRYVKWPKYVRIQRQRAILKKRLKVPPSINQFTRTLDKSTATKLFRFLGKYRPETKLEKKERLKALAAEKAEKKGEKKQDPSKRPYVVKYGLNHITALIENKKAQMVIIADDVDPLELVVWLPALCRKMDVPYCIVKSKSRLGSVVHKKNAAALCVTNIRNEDKHAFGQLVTAVKNRFTNRTDEIRKSWGGGINGIKSRTRVARLEKSKIKEALAKQKA